MKRITLLRLAYALLIPLAYGFGHADFAFALIFLPVAFWSYQGMFRRLAGCRGS